MATDNDDVRVLQMVDEEGISSSSSGGAGAAGEEEGGGYGGGDDLISPRKRSKKNKSEEGAAAARRAAAQERRAAAKMEREAAAKKKRAERTQMQVRAQALKLGRKMHAALARGGAMAASTTCGGGGGGEEEGGGGLVLAPIVIRPNGDLDLQSGGGNSGLFVQSFQTLQQIANSAESSRPVPAAPAAILLHTPAPPPASPTTTVLPGTPVRLPGVPVPPIQQPPQVFNGEQQKQQQPSYGALRGGSLPTYREYVAQQENRPLPRRTRAELELELTEDQRREQARLERELQELAVTQQYENLTRLYNTLPELRRKPVMSSMTRRADLLPPSSAVLRARSVPQQRRTVRRVFHVGRTDKEISLLTHSAATRAGVDDFRLHVQNLSTDKMRRALLAAKLLRAGSEAPEPLVRRIFQERQMLVGDLLVGNHATSNDAVSAVS